MRILFFYFSINTTVGIHHGIASLNAILKRAGHQTKLIHILEPISLKRMDSIWKEMLSFGPDLIAIPTLENQWVHIKGLCHELQYLKSFKLLGGPYPTMYPLEVVQAIGVDGVCVGDGEDVILKVLENLDRIDSYICHGFLTKTSSVYSCAKLQDLKKLPPEDYSLFDLHYILPKKNDQLEIALGRGCIYQCTYCINHSYLEKYHLKPLDYVRIKDPKNVISEIKSVIKNYAIKRIAFTDDDFLIYSVIYPRELEEFYALYTKEIHLPFTTNDNLNSWHKSRGEAHLKAGGDCMRIGIESSERLRKEILKRPMDDHQILDRVKEIQRLGIEVSTYNMIGIPTEEYGDIDSMIQLNAMILPNWIKVSTFFPYFGTPLYQYCIEHNLIDLSKQKTLENYETDSCLIFPEDYQLYLQKIQHVYHWLLNMNLPNMNPEYSNAFHIIMDMSKREWELCLSHDFEKWDRKLSNKSLNIPHYIKRSNCIAELIENKGRL